MCVVFVPICYFLFGCFQILGDCYEFFEMWNLCCCLWASVANLGGHLCRLWL